MSWMSRASWRLSWWSSDRCELSVDGVSWAVDRLCSAERQCLEWPPCLMSSWLLLWFCSGSGKSVVAG